MSPRDHDRSRPCGDPRIIAGQATVALEPLDQVPGLDILVAPVGGGGLLSGVALGTHHLRPGLRVMGAEPAWPMMPTDRRRPAGVCRPDHLGPWPMGCSPPWAGSPLPSSGAMCRGS